MKSMFHFASFTIASLALSISLQAQTPQQQEPIPCQNARKACEAAGFVVGQANIGNGVWDNCFRPLSEGKKVRKIKVSDSLKKDLKTCADLIKERQSKQNK